MVWNTLLFTNRGLPCGSILVDSARVNDFTLSLRTSTRVRQSWVATWCLGKEAGPSNPVRRGIATYLHAAGIQAGYSFFAPNVPSHHRLTLELFYEDGRVEYESPHVRGKAAALRLDSLLDRLPEERYEPVREVLVKMLAFSVWREHPDVKKVRATFEAVNSPSMTEFEQGKTETFQPMFSFDFSLREDQKQ